MESSLKFTNIQHAFRKQHGLSCNEYVMADMIYFLSTNPTSNHIGWAYKSRPSFARDLGVSKQSVLNLIKSLEDKGFIKKDEKTSYIQTTKKWNIVYFLDGKESLPPSKESLPDWGKESLPNNYNINNNIDNLYTEFSKKENSVKKPLTVYQKVIEFWLKDFHPSFTFEAVHGVKIKSLITKIKKLLKSGSFEISDETILKTFKAMCLNLPEYYKDKDLSIIDSKFNEITTEIIKNKNGTKSSNQQSKPIERYSPFATRS